MSRIIKYRAWWKGAIYEYGDGRAPEIYPPRWKNHNDCIILPNGSLAQEDYELCTISDPESYVVEQWTGLLDRDGKEIYEGDIVRCHRLRYPERKRTLDFSVLPWPEDHWYDCVEVGEITYSDVWLSFVEDYHRIRYDDIWRLEGGTEHRYEVIGNIHESPHLLTPKTP